MMETTLTYTETVTRANTLSKWQRILLLTVLGYEAAGCLLGGILLIAAPDGRLMDMPVEIMNGVFRDFLIPGILLFVLGILTTMAFFSVKNQRQNSWLMAWLALGGLTIWFWIEIAILQDIHWLHLMWGLPVVMGDLLIMPMLPARYVQRILLTSGILSSVLYAIICMITPLQWEGYNSTSQVISEFSAIGSPTRVFWMVLSTPYTFLILAFAWGVWRAGAGNQRLRIAGGLMIAYGLSGFLWPFAPMHMRETLAAGGGNVSDTMHIVLSAVTQTMYLLALGFAAAALGKQFRIYSIATFVALLIFGVLTFLESPGIGKNEPTPLIGLWERINIGLFLLWVVVLAMILIKKDNNLKLSNEQKDLLPE